MVAHPDRRRIEVATHGPRGVHWTLYSSGNVIVELDLGVDALYGALDATTPDVVPRWQTATAPDTGARGSPRRVARTSLAPPFALTRAPREPAAVRKDAPRTARMFP